MAERVWQSSTHLVERFVLWFATSGLRIFVVVLLAAIAIKILQMLTARLRKIVIGDDDCSERRQRAETLTAVAQTAGGIVIFIGASMMVLREVGLDIAPLLATAGIGGLAIGFGAQTLVKDVITGFFLLIEDDVRVEDLVEVGGKSGVVERVSLRTIRIRDWNTGAVHVIPNSSVTSVTNMTRGFSRYVVDVPVSEKADPKVVFATLEEIGRELVEDPRLKSDVLEPLEILGLESPTRAPLVKARITTRPRRQWTVGRELNLRIRQRFGEKGIELR
jgi:moderate conductance mechanosensitive channel